jgi:beta-lactam-binding protein with PASTA domain
MPVCFISYRREDSAGHAGRLFDRLRERFGRDSVFLDVVGIDAGVDFVDTLDKAVGSCDVLLAVIGREWLTCCDKQGRRRLDDPNDFIRAEISAALKRDVRVVPVLVEGAEMPPTDSLPEELKRLTRRQAVELRDSRWDSDVEALIAVLEKEAKRTAAAQPPTVAPPAVRGEPAGPDERRKPGRRALLWGIVALVAALIAVGAVWWSPWSPKTETEVTPAPTGGPPDDKQREESPSERPTVSAPNLVGLSLEEARERLRTSGLAVGEETKQTADAPARRVLSQFPRPGKQLDPGVPVDLVYAVPLPDIRIEIPNVVGVDVRQATATLRDAGFESTRRSEPSAETRNQVIRQEPAAGSRAEKGTRVTLVYATAPVLTGIEVPNVVGMDLRKAMDTLRGAGFEIARRSEPSAEPKNQVLGQQPPAGSRAEKGAQVTLIYATGTTVTETTVFIHYADEADRRTAEGLASYLRSLGLPGIAYKVLLSNRGLATGKLFYPSEGQAGLAKTIAGRSSSWLSKTYNRNYRRVQIAPELDPSIARTALVLTMPGSR